MSSSKKNYIPNSLRKQVIERAKGCCEYCKYLKSFCGDPFIVEHIIPLILKGTNNLMNLAWSCNGCNQYKHAAVSAPDPVTDQIVPLYHPRKDNWHDHFKWSGDLTKMEGLTPTGRATVIRLKTNREELINLRRVTIGHGHPPD